MKKRAFYHTSKVTCHIPSLMPSDDLQAEVIKFIVDRGMSGGFIQVCGGSLQSGYVRLAGHSSGTGLRGDHEIVSMINTLSAHRVDLPIAFSDSKSITFGGHLPAGYIVGITAESIINELKNVVFMRKPETKTECSELCIAISAKCLN